MATHLNPYLSFRDDARQAMEFYHSVFGGELTMSTFAEFHVSEDPAEADKLMHANLSTPGGLILMGADTPNSQERAETSNISVSLSGEDETELQGYWDGLSAGGTVAVPFAKAPWGDTFGMLTDKFGVDWMVNVVAAG
ncbi:VOC family protein [Cellulomonas sp. Leaf334]|uniref:VOC family protein n=1 Tax=Cellulomonas sp. Leaf334 TaxID=1736339 RepID=UPI0006FBCE26|nr:VOC family protein [Cellulomonas sp. Leaf334]KQR10962.1 3-demethylubiquinone-9 3-methyltransferase [Cellulomonas sp. Leaf334]